MVGCRGVAYNARGRSKTAPLRECAHYVLRTIRFDKGPAARHTGRQIMPPRWHQLLWGRRPLRTAVRAGLLAAGCWLLLRYVCLPMRAEGVSMQPTIRDGSWHLANLLQYRWREPRRGELAVIRWAGRRVFYLKRVLALPGERIAFVQGQLRINGRDVAEPYLREQGDWNLLEVALAPGEYFVAGDHRALPLVQHKAGTVRRADIVGGLLR